MPRRIDRRQYGDVDVACGTAEQFCGVLLAAGRDRIDVKKERISAQMRLHRFRRVAARGCGDRRNDEIGVAHRVRRGSSTTHSARVGGSPQPGAASLRKKNVPGGQHRRVGISGDCVVRFEPMKVIRDLPLAVHSSRCLRVRRVAAAQCTNHCHK
jgi:hypothetical protein